MTFDMEIDDRLNASEADTVRAPPENDGWAPSRVLAMSDVSRLAVLWSEYESTE